MFLTQATARLPWRRCPRITPQAIVAGLDRFMVASPAHLRNAAQNPATAPVSPFRDKSMEKKSSRVACLGPITREQTVASQQAIVSPRPPRHRPESPVRCRQADRGNPKVVGVVAGPVVRSAQAFSATAGHRRARHPSPLPVNRSRTRPARRNSATQVRPHPANTAPIHNRILHQNADRRAGFRGRQVRKRGCRGFLGNGARTSADSGEKAFGNFRQRLGGAIKRARVRGNPSRAALGVRKRPETLHRGPAPAPGGPRPRAKANRSSPVRPASGSSRFPEPTILHTRIKTSRARSSEPTADNKPPHAGFRINPWARFPSLLQKDGLTRTANNRQRLAPRPIAVSNRTWLPEWAFQRPG